MLFYTTALRLYPSLKKTQVEIFTQTHLCTEEVVGICRSNKYIFGQIEAKLTCVIPVNNDQGKAFT